MTSSPSCSMRSAEPITPAGSSEPGAWRAGTGQPLPASSSKCQLPAACSPSRRCRRRAGSTMTAAGAPLALGQQPRGRSASRMRSAATHVGRGQAAVHAHAQPEQHAQDRDDHEQLEQRDAARAALQSPGALDLVVGSVIVRPEHAVGPGRAELEACRTATARRWWLVAAWTVTVLRAGVALHPVGEAVGVVALRRCS